MSDVQNILCVVVRTLPKAIVIIIVIIYVNLIVPEGLDTPNNMYSYLVFTVVMLPSSEVLAVVHMQYLQHQTSKNFCSYGV